MEHNSTMAETAQGDEESPEMLAYLSFDGNFNAVVMVSRLIHGTLGIAGSLLLLFTFVGNKQFDEPCYVCYKALAVASFLYSSCEILGPVYRIIMTFDFPSKYEMVHSYPFYVYTWTRFVVVLNLYNTSEHISIYLTTFLSCHRAVACLLPTKFRLINKRSVCWVVTIGAYLLPIAYCLPAYILEDVARKPVEPYEYYLWQPPTDSYKTYLRAISSIYLVQIPAVLISSGLAIAGLLKVVASRRKLKRVNPAPLTQMYKSVSTVTQTNGPNVPQANDSQTEESRKIKNYVQMCMLQLSQAIPYATFCISHFVCLTWFSDDDQFVYDNAGNIVWSSSYTWTWVYQVDLILESLANDYHFYLILIFSRMFRKEFRKRVATVFKK